MTAQADHSDVPSYGDMLSLDGRGFIVAGAGNGIGRQTAHALAANGARVVCVDVVGEFAEQVADEVGGVPLVADMCDRSGVEAALATANDSCGGLAGIVDIIGMTRFLFLADTTDDDWDWHQRTNLRHAFLIAQLGGKELARQGGGTLVYVASVSGISGAQKQAAYGAAKAGVISLVKSAAVELGPVGVRVNAVAPGVVLTPRIGATLGEERQREWTESTPLKRLGVPSDIASAALFLSSDLSAFVTGQTVVVDGGTGQRFPYPIETLGAS
jgi:NAD(P)-dependent dehydrogenase (short-subunit alcohol dehydrogenase family)